MEYELIRSDRRTIGIEISENGLKVRAPFNMPDKVINKFLNEKKDRIEKNLEKFRQRKAASENIPPLTAEEITVLADKAMKVIPERVAFYAPIVGVTYGRITIRNQQTRWGSCSAKGNLNFNCLLMLTPPEVVDSVVVHELCHRKEMNHSPAFYKEVLRVYPNYIECDKWLKKNGNLIMSRMKK